jgi:hydroxymethylpyrimidine pyrophosphatase-like HAD family hydrolase
MKRRPPPPPRVIAVDVDGTLLISGQPNTKLIAFLRTKKEEGFTLHLWSSRGETHARRTAEAFGVTDLFHVICSKPGFVIDDQGWNWIRYTAIVSDFG